MKKTDFLEQLRKNLEGIPQQDIENSIEYYSEMIDDRIEEGLDEEKAVETIGSPEEAAKEILKGIPFASLVKTKVKSRRKMSATEIILLVLGAPIWLPLIISAFAILFALYITLWIATNSLWAVPVSVGACALAALILTPICGIINGFWSGLFLLACALTLTSICIFTFLGCVYAVKGLCKLTEKIFIGIKSCFIKKGDSK